MFIEAENVGKAIGDFAAEPVSVQGLLTKIAREKRSGRPSLIGNEMKFVGRQEPRNLGADADADADAEALNRGERTGRRLRCCRDTATSRDADQAPQALGRVQKWQREQMAGIGIGTGTRWQA